MKFLIFLLAVLSSTSALTFNCTFGWRDFVYLSPPSRYGCINPTITFDGSENLTDVNGVHESGKTHADVEMLTILNVTELTFFPRKIEEFFSNLIAISVDQCDIRALNGDELEPFDKMTWIRLSHNLNLERIPGNLFSLNQLIETIFINQNNISHVGEDLLVNLPNLSHANFNFNKCINQAAVNVEQINYLINSLRNQCPDIIITTTEEPTITTTPDDSSCGDSLEIVCSLQQEVQLLIEEKNALIVELEEYVAGLQLMHAENIAIKSNLNYVFIKSADCVCTA